MMRPSLRREIRALPSCLCGVVRGPAKMSRIIRFITNGRGNHCIFYKKNGRIFEAIGKGQVEGALSKYLGRRFEVWLFQYLPITPIQIECLLADCKEKKGWIFYDWFATLKHVLPFLTELKWAKNCVELVITLFRNWKIPLCPRMKPHKPNPEEVFKYLEKSKKWHLVYHHKGNKS